uniref:Uncharacterized protein n=1 Tax=Arundo donax TaxID=35708 RepID=A0A0A9E0F5_ARUDO
MLHVSENDDDLPQDLKFGTIQTRKKYSSSQQPSKSATNQWTKKDLDLRSGIQTTIRQQNQREKGKETSLGR